MKLDLDCCRDILLEMESCGFNQSISLCELKKQLPQYPEDLLQYTCYKLLEANLVVGLCVDMDNLNIPYIHQLTDITFSGHQFLAKIRDEVRWSKAKKGLSTIRDYSLSAITAFADGMTSAAISAYFSGKTSL